MKKYAFIFVLMLCSVSTKAQTLLEKIVDSSLVKEQHEFILSKLDSAFFFTMGEYVRPFKSKDCVIHEIYSCHTKYVLNCISYYEESLNPIDTNLFNKDYFVSGKFLEEFANLKEQGKVYIDYMFTENVFIFDTANNKSYNISKSPKIYEIKNSNSLEKSDTTSQFGYKVYRYFEAEENDFLGELFKSKKIELIFHYPTFTHHDGSPTVRYISWELGYCFGMQGNQFFYIDTWGKKIYPMEEVVENHWDWITNVKQK